jgi:hypothetical protein
MRRQPAESSRRFSNCRYEARRWIFCRVSEDQELVAVEGSTPSKAEKETAGKAGASTIEASAPNDTDRKKTTTLKEFTEPYQGAARDERT